MRFLTTNFVTESETTLTASNIDPNFPVSNLKNQLRSKRVRTTEGTTTLTVVFDMQTTEDINSVILLWPKEDGIRLTDSATLKIQANATNVWTAPSVDQSLTINNDYSVASHFFSSNQSYRYWRVVIEDATNPYDFIELGLVWLGTSLDVDNAQNGFKWTDTDRSQSVENEFGHRYTDEYPITSQLEFAFQYLEYSDIEILVQAFRTNGSRYPVLVVLDHSDTVFDKDHLLIYGTMSNSLGLSHVNYNLLNIEGIKITEIS